MRVQLDGLAPVAPARARSAPEQLDERAPREEFARELSRAIGSLSLSRHAARRVERRELRLDPARVARLESAVRRAAEKGARQSVVLLDELAFVVDVRGRTVVTAMNHRIGGGERVFTNVDSVVIA